MVVSVLHKPGQALSQLFARPSLLGDRLSDRLRSATFAMLGLTTAVGLGLIAFVLQQGWPSVLGGPIPGFPSERSDTEATSAPPPAPNGGATRAHRSGSTVVPVPVGRGGAEPDDSQLSGSRQVAGAAPTSPGPTGAEPPGEGAPGQQPAGQPPVATPAPAPTPAPSAASSPSTPLSTAGSLDNDKGKGSAKSEGHGKSKAHSPPKKSYSPPKPKAKPRSGEPPVPVKEEPPTAGYAEDPYKDKSVPASEGKGKGNAYGHYK